MAGYQTFTEGADVLTFAQTLKRSERACAKRDAARTVRNAPKSAPPTCGAAERRKATVPPSSAASAAAAAAAAASAARSIQSAPAGVPSAAAVTSAKIYMGERAAVLGDGTSESANSNSWLREPQVGLAASCKYHLEFGHAYPEANQTYYMKTRGEPDSFVTLLENGNVALSTCYHAKPPRHNASPLSTTWKAVTELDRLCLSFSCRFYDELEMETSGVYDINSDEIPLWSIRTTWDPDLWLFSGTAWRPDGLLGRQVDLFAKGSQYWRRMIERAEHIFDTDPIRGVGADCRLTG